MDGSAEPVRVRFAYLIDTDIASMVEEYDPLPSVWEDPQATSDEDTPGSDELLRGEIGAA